MIRLSARVDADDEQKVSPRSEDEAYVTASEDTEEMPPLRDLTNMFNQADSEALKKEKKTRHKSESSFSTKNPYALLEESSNEEDDATDDESSANSGGEDNTHTPDTPILTKPRPLPLLPTHLMMPKESSPFWAKYGNVLRVNGTVEGNCPLLVD